MNKKTFNNILEVYKCAAFKSFYKKGVKYMNLLEYVKEKLSVFKNLYDSIRIVDPIKKKINMDIDNSKEELSGKCYTLWKKQVFCENCISMRAYNNNNTFIKIEHDKERIILMIATPIEIDGKVFIVEMLKDITKNGDVSHKLTENSDLMRSLVKSINEKAVKDDLTGVYNRKYINERLPIDIMDNKISKSPISIIMTDIDFFKKVNDKYGSANGDKMLIDFSNLILKSIRNNIDWIGRYDEKKFIIVLNHTDLKNTYILAEKIRKQLENTIFKYDDNSINITASFGIYSVTDYNIELSELFSRVSKSLYQSKVSGKNRTTIRQKDANKDDSSDVHIKSTKLSRLDEQIDELRELLNEVCCTLDEDKDYADRLIISQCLDELIVEYMKEINNLK